MRGTAAAPSGRWAGLARAVVALRYVVVACWVAVAALATVALPSIQQAGGGSFGGLVPEDNPAIQAEIASVVKFGFPILSRVAVVQRDPDGFSALKQAEIVNRAARLTQHRYPGLERIGGALPVINTLGVVPGSREANTTAITFLYFDPRMGFAEQTELARRFARTQVDEPDDHLVGVTGAIPGRLAQARTIERSLPRIELATLAAVVVIVGLNYRSVGAPLVCLAAATVAYLVSVRVVAWLGRLIGVAVPSELEPLMVALLLGIVTDYAIFFLSAVQHRLRAGDGVREAAARATATVGPIVVAAGLTVAAGTAALLAARLELFQAFGPGMALTILVGLVVAVTLVPALLAIAGQAAFWPARPAGQDRANEHGRRRPTGRGGTRQERVVRRMTTPRVAALLVAGCTLLLLVATLPLRQVDLALTIVRSLPAEAEAQRAAAAATKGFAPGILSPTVVVVSQPGVTRSRGDLAAFQDLLEQQPGVAAVVGPREQLTQLVLGAVLSRDQDAARYVLVLAEDPLGSTAIDRLAALRDRVPVLLDRAGLDGATARFAGDTALAEAIVRQTRGDLGRIALAAILVDLLLLVVYLRALVAPLYLLATSVLALGASLGLTTLVFQRLLGHDGLTFYVPFAAAVLLVALGSDYNIFGVGAIWEEARRRPLREAIVVAVPRSTRAIAAAGLTLAASFALLALVPLEPFREFAFAMFVGILLDAFVVRSLLVPCLVALVGRRSGWPSRRLEPAPVAAAAASAPTGQPPTGQPP
jgi:RND superfamily putative drug exporter